MNKLLMSFGAAAIEVVCVAQARAEILTEPKAIMQAVTAGRPGAWVDQNSLKLCLAAEQDRDILEQQFQLCGMIKISLEQEINETKLQVEGWQRETMLAQQREQDAKRELQKWYRNPWIIGALGIAVGTTATIVAAVRITR